MSGLECAEGGGGEGWGGEGKWGCGWGGFLCHCNLGREWCKVLWGWGSGEGRGGELLWEGSWGKGCAGGGFLGGDFALGGLVDALCNGLGLWLLLFLGGGLFELFVHAGGWGWLGRVGVGKRWRRVREGRCGFGSKLVDFLIGTAKMRIQISDSSDLIEVIPINSLIDTT